jgi:hypothetical protein
MVPAEDNAVVIIVELDMAVICYSVLSATKMTKSSYDIDCTNGNPLNKMFMIYDVFYVFRPSIRKWWCLSKIYLVLYVIVERAVKGRCINVMALYYHFPHN